MSRRAFASNSTAEAIEAEFVEKENAPPTGASDEIPAPPTTKADWCGDAPCRATYGRIIDAARLVAEVAYSTNEANVGALAEASGDEGAAERWLRGVLRLLEDRMLPAWWDAGHREEVLRLAARRNLGYYAKRCVDVERLEKDLGREAFKKLKDVALEVHMAVVMEHVMPEDEDDDEIRGTLAISKDAIDEAIKIWGEETTKQLFKRTKEDIEEEQAHAEEFGSRLREQL